MLTLISYRLIIRIWNHVNTHSSDNTKFNNCSIACWLSQRPHTWQHGAQCAIILLTHLTLMVVRLTCLDWELCKDRSLQVCQTRHYYCAPADPDRHVKHQLSSPLRILPHYAHQQWLYHHYNLTQFDVYFYQLLSWSSSVQSVAIMSWKWKKSQSLLTRKCS